MFEISFFFFVERKEPSSMPTEIPTEMPTITSQPSNAPTQYPTMYPMNRALGAKREIKYQSTSKVISEKSSSNVFLNEYGEWVISSYTTSSGLTREKALKYAVLAQLLAVCACALLAVCKGKHNVNKSNSDVDTKMMDHDHYHYQDETAININMNSITSNYNDHESDLPSMQIEYNYNYNANAPLGPGYDDNGDNDDDIDVSDLNPFEEGTVDNDCNKYEGQNHKRYELCASSIATNTSWEEWNATQLAAYVRHETVSCGLSQAQCERFVSDLVAQGMNGKMVHLLKDNENFVEQLRQRMQKHPLAIWMVFRLSIDKLAHKNHNVWS